MAFAAVIVGLSACGSGPLPGVDPSGATATPAWSGGKADSLAQRACRPNVMFGAYTYGGVWGGMKPVTDLEATLGYRLDVVHWFMNWSHPWPAEMIAEASADGRRPMISWQPTDRSLTDITAGRYDDYLRTWARGAAALDTTIYLRPFPEMNGDWVSWWEDDPDALVAAWRHVVDLFRAAGADNVRWVWSPNVTDEPRTERNRLENFYPGDDWVDVLAIDGYNRGNGPWVSYEDRFAAAYARVTALGPQPVWLAEIASREEGGDKAAWVRAMFESRAFDRIEAIVWFDEDKEWDWRIRSSVDTCVAFCRCLSGRSEAECLMGADGSPGCAVAGVD